MGRKSEKKSHCEITYDELSSHYKETDKISICTLKHENTSEVLSDKKRTSIFFVPEIGVSYRSYFPYLKELLRKDVDSIFTYDHFGSGSSGRFRLCD